MWFCWLLFLSLVLEVINANVFRDKTFHTNVWTGWSDKREFAQPGGTHILLKTNTQTAMSTKEWSGACVWDLGYKTVVSGSLTIKATKEKEIVGSRRNHGVTGEIFKMEKTWKYRVRAWKTSQQYTELLRSCFWIYNINIDEDVICTSYRIIEFYPALQSAFI